jgi:hypothetical protein
LLKCGDDKHPRSDTRSIHPLADGDHSTDTFRAQRRGQLRAHPVDAPDQIQIRLVDRRRLDRHRKLAGARIRRINLGQFDDICWFAEARKLKRLHRDLPPVSW